VSKVHFQSHAGLLVTGNLFVPRGRPGPFPAVLNPHGHWQEGRLADQELGTVLGRGISFARQGYVAFCYDMIGYNDSTQVVHRQESDRQRLWGFSQMALQLYNSMRAVDFLLSLPEVDPQRIACTGESGGGTQTFMLMAVDGRIKVAAPVNMVSAHMQGGCVCENAPSLRLDTTNPEIAALMAPRPLLLVSCTGDWTKDTPRVEYPFLRSIYDLYRAGDRVEWVQFEADHNYNLDSRNAVYRFFGKWLLGEQDPEKLRERPYRLDSSRKYLVFADRNRPSYAPAGEKLLEKLTRQRRRQIEAMWPSSKEELRHLQGQLGPALKHLLMATVPAPREVRAIRTGSKSVGGAVTQDLLLTRPAVGDRVPAQLLRPAAGGKPKATLVVSDHGKAALLDADGGPAEPIAKMLKRGQTVLLIDCWGTGQARIPKRRDRRAAKIHHYLTYNRSDDANRIQDILTGLGYLRSRRGIGRIDLMGLGYAGAWALLARTQAPFVARAMVDMAPYRRAADSDFVEHLLIPGIRGIGDLWAAVALIAPAPLCLLNLGDGFDTSLAERAYAAAGKPGHLCLHRR
jgi:dienelactone hydrolase